jgi:cobalamin-dependent methionine synthase I
MPGNKHRHYIATPQEEAMKRPSPIRDQIIALYQQGLSNNEICIVTGKNAGNVSNVLSVARQQGVLSGYKPRVKSTEARSIAGYVATRARGKKKYIGCMQEITGTLPKEIADWLITQTPVGEALSLTIKAIIIDAYHEETEK